MLHSAKAARPGLNTPCHLQPPLPPRFVACTSWAVPSFDALGNIERPGRAGPAPHPGLVPGHQAPSSMPLAHRELAKDDTQSAGVQEG